MSKPRSDSILSQLPEEQQTQIYDWLLSVGYVQTQKNIAAPPPAGFGIKTHMSSLRRLYLRHSQKAREDDLAELADLLKSAHPSTANLAAITEDAVAHAAFQLSTAPPEVETFHELSRWLAKQKSHQLKERYVQIAEQHLALAKEQLTLEKKKFEFNAARVALEHAHDLNQIADETNLDDEDKIRRAREKLFGPNLPD
jgi:hypothetical protein